MNKNRTVLLLNPPYKETIIRDNYCCFTSKSGYVWPPVDLLYLSGILHDKSVTIRVIDAIGERLSWKRVLNKAERLNPDIVIMLTGTVSFEEDFAGLAHLVRRGRKLYVLGNFPVFQPSFCLGTYDYIDGVLHNFMDYRVKDFLLGKTNSCESISYRQSSGKAKIGKINVMKQGEEIVLPYPPLYHQFPLKRYYTPFIRKRPMATMLTSFGCPFRCAFCVASALQFQTRRLSDVKAELNALKSYGVREIFFEDSTFNNNRMKEICELMIKKNYGFSWSANIHSYRANKEILSLMKQAGCHTVQIGIESGNETTLATYAPSKLKQNIRTAVSTARSVGLDTLGYFIIGFPNETAASSQNTLSFSRELDLDFASFSVLTPDYGTAFYEEARRQKLLEDPITSFDSSADSVLANPHFTSAEQKKVIRQAYVNFYLHPRKILKMLRDLDRLMLYASNAVRLIFKYFSS